MGAVFGVVAGFSCPDIARALLAKAPPTATFFKNSRRSNFPFFRVATIPSPLAHVGATLVVARSAPRPPLLRYSRVPYKGIVIGQGREKGNY